MAIEPEDVITQVALADAAVTAAIGARIYPDMAPQSAEPPYVIVTRIDAVREHALSGAAGCGTARVQVDVYDRSKTGAWAVAEALRSALFGWSGTRGGRRCSILLESDTSEIVPQPDGGSGAGGKAIRRVSQDYSVFFDESVPTV